MCASNPQNTKVHVTKLTGNVTKEHVDEIFGHFGKIKDISFPLVRWRIPSNSN